MPAVPLLGDRSAHDVINYPELHASDLAADTPINHVPTGLVIGDTLVWDGTKWLIQAAAAPVSTSIMTLGTVEGDVSIMENPFRIYNRYGADRNITEVFLSVESEPTGDSIIVDVAVDGISIFTGGDEPEILEDTFTGVSATITNPTWPYGSYLTWEILQVGDLAPGSNLVVHIISEVAPAGSGS